MRVMADGKKAVTFEPFGGIVRGLERAPKPGDETPDFVFSGVIEHWTPQVAKLSAFNGEMHQRHMRLIMLLLMEQGYRWVYAVRQPGRTLPFGEEIVEGEFRGMVRIDLTLADLRQGAGRDGEA